MSSSCQAAKDLEDRRFLSGAAPRIPLPDCDAAECKCKFVHHKDRRSGEDRRNSLGKGLSSPETGKHQVEQRKRRERREDPPESIF